MAAFDQYSDAKHGSVTKSGRPMSAASRFTGRDSKMTYVPDLSRQQLMIVATDIYRNRQPISEILKSANSNMRVVMSSSQILGLTRKIGIFMEIAHLKGLLRELGFNWNGPSCSFLDLFAACKGFLYG